MRELVKKILIVLFRLLPLRDDIILESHPDFADNTWALYEYFLKKGVNKRHRIHWALHGQDVSVPKLPEQTDTFYLDAKGFSQMWKRFFVLYRSRYIIDCNTFIHKRRKGQIRLHLGHGVPLKVALDYTNPKKIGACDGYLLTGPYWFDYYVNRIGLPQEILVPLGYPRNDILVKKPDKKKRKTGYIVWMPTYRQHRSLAEWELKNEYPYGMPEVQNQKQLLALEKRLAQKDMLLYFRPHPAQELSLFKTEVLPHIQMADDAFLQAEHISLYELLASADALITDYSSVYYDFLLTEKPIGLTIKDRKEFFAQYDCPFDDFKKNIKGSYIESFEELLTFVEKVAEKEEILPQAVLRTYKERYHAVWDGSSSERIYSYLREKFGFDKE